MADPVLKFPGEQAPPAADAKRKPLSGRLQQDPPADPARHHPADRRHRRPRRLSLRRPLHDHRQRLCRRAEGAGDAGHLRQDQQGRGARRPARAGRRRAVRDRRRAVPPCAAAGGGARRQRPHRSRQSSDQRQGDVAHDRACAEDRRAEAPGRRTQIDADGQPQRFAVRPRFVPCASSSSRRRRSSN